jgi:hypothetical protein
MRFEVPQFIDIEDKIFGPLTWRQFLYLGGGIGMGVTLFIVGGFFVFLLIGLPLALLAGALAFYPMNNRPFSFFLEAIYNYATGKKLYLWRKNENIVYRQNLTPSKSASKQIESTDNLPPNLSRPTVSLARRLELEAMQKTE